MSKETKSFMIPVVMLKEDENYIISCDALGIYSQSNSKETVQKDFERCINMLLNKWDEASVLEIKLRDLGLIEPEAERIYLDMPNIQKTHRKSKLGVIDSMALQLGNITSLHGSLVCQ